LVLNVHQGAITQTALLQFRIVIYSTYLYVVIIIYFIIVIYFAAIKHITLGLEVKYIRVPWREFQLASHTKPRELVI